MRWRAIDKPAPMAYLLIALIFFCFFVLFCFRCGFRCPMRQRTRYNTIQYNTSHIDASPGCQLRWARPSSPAVYSAWRSLLSLLYVALAWPALVFVCARFVLFCSALLSSAQLRYPLAAPGARSHWPGLSYRPAFSLSPLIGPSIFHFLLISQFYMSLSCGHG